MSKEKEVKKQLCVICKNPYEGYGHNPAPVSEIGRCCDACNWNVVIQARLNFHLKKEK